MDKTLSAADLPRLVVQLPDGKEVHHSIAGSEVTIGRDPSNRITIADHFVSKFHAKLLVSDASLTLVDLESANKTYVNDRPITEAPVRYGDEIRFAGVRCRLLAPENMERAAAAVAPPVPTPRERPSVQSPLPPSALPPPGPPPPRPAAAPKAKPAPRPAPAGGVKRPGAEPPPIEADPMKRLLRIGGLLILVSLALAVLLRVLLVPSETTPTNEESPAAASAGSATNPAPAAAPPQQEPVPTVSTPPTTAPSASAASGRRPSPSQTETAEGYFDQALSYLDTGRLKDARTAFQKVLELEPDNTRAQTRLSLLEEEIAQKAELHFGNARQAFQYLRYEEAIAEWEMFLTLADPTDVRYQEAEQGIAQAKAKLR